MKILISETFNYSFDVNLFAIKELLKRKGLEAFFYRDEYDEYNNITAKRLSDSEKLEDLQWCEEDIVVTTTDYGEYVSYSELLEYDFDLEDLRTDKDLITIYEQYGSKISDYELGIKEIPDGTYYYISDDGGFEHIIVKEDYNWKIAEDNS